MVVMRRLVLSTRRSTTSRSLTSLFSARTFTSKAIHFQQSQGALSSTWNPLANKLYHYEGDGRYSSTSVNDTAQTTSISKSDNGDSLHVKVGDDNFRADALWLRDSCRCSQCVNPSSGQKYFQTTDIPLDIRIAKVEEVGEGLVALHWGHDIPGLHKPHQTVVSEGFLVDQKLRNDVLRPRATMPQIWRGSDPNLDLNFLDYHQYLEDEHTLSEALTQLTRKGLVFLKDVPRSEESVEYVAARLGPLRTTFYGKTWDVRDKPNAENVAYTSGHLGLHADLLYMKTPPGFQLLHCLDSSCTGGESMFSDGLLAASIMEHSAPDEFDLLTRFPISYRYYKNDYLYQDSKPLFELRSYPSPNSPNLPQPDPSLPRFYSVDHINWSPPFQGPFKGDDGRHDNGQELRRFHLAAKNFADIIEDPRNVYSHRLQPGECVIFDNRRVLHGRKQFDSGTGARWLKGAYIDTQDVLSTQSRFKERRWSEKNGGRVRADFDRDLDDLEEGR